ncbi:MAG: biopolymer transport protein ExbD [Chthoniobacter sp.]|jgi:biopolymer transport protein ExbD|nr:biopolymer transport protein ExbD [Chthoniobacter sp.]
MKFYTRKRRVPSVIIVSLIDILAILLIFVIVTTTFKSAQPEVVIKLPESSTAIPDANPANPAVLAITKDEQLFLDGKSVAIDELLKALQGLLAATPNRPLALSADTKAPFGLIIKVLDVLKQAGVKNLPAFTEAK